MEKNELRQHHQQLRMNMTKADILKYSKVITNELLNLTLLDDAENVFIYHAFRNEVILDPRRLKNWMIAMPQVINQDTMVFRHIDADTVFEKSAYGVLEPVTGQLVTPSSSTVVLVPGSAFDRLGNRVGYGAGYYDRYLAKYPDTTTIGVCYEHQLVDTLPSEAHDRRMDYIITEKQVISRLNP